MGAGFNSSGMPFECVVSEAKNYALKMKKLSLIALYALWVIVFFSIVMIIKLYVLITFVPVTLWMLVFFTWRYTQVQYEYSFFAGEITVSRILNERFRKEMLKVHIREFSSVVPCRDEYLGKINAFNAEKIFFAASAKDAPNRYAAMWQDEESGDKKLLYFEPDEKSLKILRYYNSAAMTK